MVGMNKRITAIGLTAGLLAGAGAGVLLEHSGGVGASAGRANLTAGNNGISITSPADGSLGGDIVGDSIPDGPGPGEGDGGPGRGGFGANLDAVATLLKVSIADLQSALQNGQTLAQIATAHGTTPKAVIDVLVAAVKAHFAPEVASGEHTQLEVDQMIAGFTAQISDFVNNGTVFPGRGAPIVGGVPGANGFPGIGSPGGAGPNDGGPHDGGPHDGGPNDGGPSGTGI
jgi:hypothetical protein